MGVEWWLELKEIPVRGRWDTIHTSHLPTYGRRTFRIDRHENEKGVVSQRLQRITFRTLPQTLRERDRG